MATRSPIPFHNYWGFSNPTTAAPWTSGTLPNEGAVPVYQSDKLQAGDFAYVAADSTFYLCTDPGVGNANAVWVALSTGGGASTDRFAPKYLVGSPSDTAAALLGIDGFWFFPDTGDGAGIQAALAQAVIAPGDVYIRPGTYDIGSGAVTLPLLVPAGVRVIGAGSSSGGTQITYAVPSAAVGTAFRLRDGAELRDIAITATDASDATGIGVVEIGGGPQPVPAAAHCERVAVSLTRADASTSTLRSAFYVWEDSSLTQDRCDVLLDGTGASVQPVVPLAIEPVAPPTPTGSTWTVGTGGDYTDLATALASASVVNGDRLLLFAQTFTVLTTITVAKQVTIQGAGLASTVLQTAGAGADPVTVITVTANNVTIRDLTVKQRRTTNTSIETAISINPPGGGAGATGHFIEAVRVETMEFGIIIRSDGWQINNCQLAYVGPSNATRRLVATYRSNGQGLFCNSTFDSGQDPTIFAAGTSTGGNSSTTFNDTSQSWTVNAWVGLTLTITGGTGVGQTRTITSNTATQITTTAWATIPDTTSTYTVTLTGNTRVFSILTTTGLPTEITGGYLRLGNITPSNAFLVQQFFNCEWFPVNPSLLTLYVDNCVTSETSAFVVWANSASGLLSRFTSITFANNTLSGNHGGTPIGCKGMFAVDSSGANAQPWGSTTFYASGNVIGNITFITAPAPWQTIMDTAAPPGYSAAELALAGWDGTYFVGNPALQFPTQLVPPDPNTAITGWRTEGDLRLDVCSCEGGDAGVLALPPVDPAALVKVDIDQSRFSDFSLLGVGCFNSELAVTGGTRIESASVDNPELFGIICRQYSQQSNLSTVLINARIKLPDPTENPSTSTGIDIDVESGQITASRVEAASGIVSANATGRGVAIGFNNVISQPGQQISSQIVDEVAHNILST